MVGIEEERNGLWLGQRMGLHSFNPLSPPSRLTDWCWWHLSLISAYLHLLPQIQAVVWLWKTLGQVLKCIHERLLWENCVIFASEWCNSKAMIESKTITMKQFSMPHTFHIFSDILYLVCAEDCQEPWVMGLLSTGNISHSERWAGGELWNKQFVINRLYVCYIIKLEIMVFITLKIVLVEKFPSFCKLILKNALKPNPR